MSIELTMPSKHLILCHPLLLPSIFPSIRVFSNELALCIRWPEYWNFSFSISPSNEYSGLIFYWLVWSPCSPRDSKESSPTPQFKSINSLVLNFLNGKGNGTPLQYSCLENPMDGGAWWAAVHGVAKSRTRLSDFTFTFHFPALEKEMATHSSVLAWRIPGTGEPGGLASMGSHRVGHDWSDLAAGGVVLGKLYITYDSDTSFTSFCFFIQIIRVSEFAFKNSFFRVLTKKLEADSISR